MRDGRENKAGYYHIRAKENHQGRINDINYPWACIHVLNFDYFISNIEVLVMHKQLNKKYGLLHLQLIK